VVAGAKRKRRLDLDADGVGRDAGAVMGAMHDEASGAHRLEAGEALRHPIDLRHLLECERLCRGLVGSARDQCAHRGLIDICVKMDRDLPLPAIGLEGRAGGVVERFAGQRGNHLGGRLIAVQTGDGGRGIGHAERRFALRICARNGYVAAMGMLQ